MMDIQKELVVWDDRFKLGIDVIDEQHKHLVQMCNELFGGCLLGKEEADRYFKKAIKEAIAYVQEHFRDEEKILLYFNYPGYQIHKQEHEKFIREILRQTAEFDKGAVFVPNQFARFLRDWILQHIAIEDLKYAQFVLANSRA